MHKSALGDGIGFGLEGFVIHCISCKRGVMGSEYRNNTESTYTSLILQCLVSFLDM